MLNTSNRPNGESNLSRVLPVSTECRHHEPDHRLYSGRCLYASVLILVRPFSVSAVSFEWLEAAYRQLR